MLRIQQQAGNSAAVTPSRNDDGASVPPPPPPATNPVQPAPLPPPPTLTAFTEAQVASAVRSFVTGQSLRVVWRDEKDGVAEWTEWAGGVVLELVRELQPAEEHSEDSMPLVFSASPVVQAKVAWPVASCPHLARLAESDGDDFVIFEFPVPGVEYAAITPGAAGTGPKDAATVKRLIAQMHSSNGGSIKKKAKKSRGSKDDLVVVVADDDDDGAAGGATNAVDGGKKDKKSKKEKKRKAAEGDGAAAATEKGKHGKEFEDELAGMGDVVTKLHDVVNLVRKGHLKKAARWFARAAAVTEMQHDAEYKSKKSAKSTAAATAAATSAASQVSATAPAGGTQQDGAVNGNNNGDDDPFAAVAGGVSTASLTAEQQQQQTPASPDNGENNRAGGDAVAPASAMVTAAAEGAAATVEHKYRSDATRVYEHLKIIAPPPPVAPAAAVADGGVTADGEQQTQTQNDKAPAVAAKKPGGKKKAAGKKAAAEAASAATTDAADEGNASGDVKTEGAVDGDSAENGGGAAAAAAVAAAAEDKQKPKPKAKGKKGDKAVAATPGIAAFFMKAAPKPAAPAASAGADGAAPAAAATAAESALSQAGAAGAASAAVAGAGVDVAAPPQPVALCPLFPYGFVPGQRIAPEHVVQLWKLPSNEALAAAQEHRMQPAAASADAAAASSSLQRPSGGSSTLLALMRAAEMRTDDVSQSLHKDVVCAGRYSEDYVQAQARPAFCGTFTRRRAADLSFVPHDAIVHGLARPPGPTGGLHFAAPSSPGDMRSLSRVLALEFEQKRVLIRPKKRAAAALASLSGAFLARAGIGGKNSSNNGKGASADDDAGDEAYSDDSGDDWEQLEDGDEDASDVSRSSSDSGESDEDSDFSDFFDNEDEDAANATAVDGDLQGATAGVGAVGGGGGALSHELLFRELPVACNGPFRRLAELQLHPNVACGPDVIGADLPLSVMPASGKKAKAKKPSESSAALLPIMHEAIVRDCVMTSLYQLGEAKRGISLAAMLALPVTPAPTKPATVGSASAAAAGSSPTHTNNTKSASNGGGGSNGNDNDDDDDDDDVPFAVKLGLAGGDAATPAAGKPQPQSQQKAKKESVLPGMHDAASKTMFKNAVLANKTTESAAALAQAVMDAFKAAGKAGYDFATAPEAQQRKAAAKMVDKIKDKWAWDAAKQEWVEKPKAEAKPKPKKDGAAPAAAAAAAASSGKNRLGGTGEASDNDDGVEDD